MNQKSPVRTGLWREGVGFADRPLFRPFPMRGHVLRVSNIPYDLHIIADVDPDPESPR